ADELLAQILDEDLLDAEHLGLLAGGLQLLALAEIGGEGHHLAAVGLLQPLQDHRGVEPAGIGEHHLLHVAALHRKAAFALEWKAAYRAAARPAASRQRISSRRRAAYSVSSISPRSCNNSSSSRRAG